MKVSLRFVRQRHGAAAVEFALVAPVFLLVLLTLVAYAIYLSASHSLQQLAADIARTAVSATSQAERVDLVTQYMKSSSLSELLDRTKVSVNVQPDPDNPSGFTVTASYDVGALPIWDLYTFPLPDRAIRKTIAVTM